MAEEHGLRGLGFAPVRRSRCILGGDEDRLSKGELGIQRQIDTLSRHKYVRGAQWRAHVGNEIAHERGSDGEVWRQNVRKREPESGLNGTHLRPQGTSFRLRELLVFPWGTLLQIDTHVAEVGGAGAKTTFRVGHDALHHMTVLLEVGHALAQTLHEVHLGLAE